MTRHEHKQIVNELCHNMARHIGNLVDEGHIPKSWDGHELRQLLKDKFASATYLDKDRGDRRFKEYKNTVIVNNL